MTAVNLVPFPSRHAVRTLIEYRSLIDDNPAPADMAAFYSFTKKALRARYRARAYRVNVVAIADARASVSTPEPASTLPDKQSFLADQRSAGGLAGVSTEAHGAGSGPGRVTLGAG